MKKQTLYYRLTMLVLLFFASCTEFETDLDVANTENPDLDTLYFDASALESTAAGLYQNWYMATTSTGATGFAMNTMADVSTCSWGNYAMRDTSSEPRVAFNNATSYSYADITEDMFNAYYSILSDANVIMAQVDAGLEFEEPELMQAIAKFAQALTIGYNALVFDQVWLSDETGSLNDGEAVDYATAMDFALEKLDEAIAICDSSSFSVPETWFPGSTMTNVELSQLMNSYGARMLTMVSRNGTEKAATDWSKVLDYTNNAIASDFEILHDDTTWYDLLKTYLVYPGWARIDMYVINKMDPNTPDYWPTGATILDPSTSDDARLESDFEYLSSNSFLLERGDYHFSSYRYARYDEYISEWTITTPEIYKAEIDLYAAEANLQLGNVADAASIINAGTRVTRGGLPPIASDADEVSDAIHYERLVEMPLLSMGLTFFEMRKEDLLQEGTLLHFPVPGSALIAIPADNYTYGGTTGEAGYDYSIGGWR